MTVHVECDGKELKITKQVDNKLFWLLKALQQGNKVEVGHLEKIKSVTIIIEEN